MTRVKHWLPLLTLAFGLLAGALLRPGFSMADTQGTPQSSVVTGFTSDQLLQLPTGLSAFDGAAPRIELRGEDGSSSPATVSLARHSYDPGGAISLPYPFPGPVAFYVESGTLTLESVGPQVQIAAVQRDTSSDRGVIVLGGDLGHEYTIAAGNYVYALDGNLGPTRNDGAEPLTILAVFLQPESGASEEETNDSLGTPIGS